MLEDFKKIFLAFSRAERAIFVFAALLVVLCSSTLFAFWIQKSTKIVPTSGGELTEGIVGQPTHLNPIIATSETDKAIIRLVFNNLTDLAEKIEASKDGRTWKVRLKEKLVWQDGEKLTSDDVIFTVQKIQDPESQSPFSSAWQGVLATRLSELELQFVLANPYAFFSYNLDGLFVVPKHLLDDVAPANWRLSEYNLKPVGSGPYAFDSYKARPDGFIEIYRLKTNQRYAADHPFIETMNFQFYSDATELIKGFNLGQIDTIAGLNADDMKEIKRPNKSFSFRLPRYYAVFLNQSKNLALKERDVRMALALAIDKPQLATEILGGRGVAVDGPIPPGANYSNTEDSASSLELANQTLERAGWKLNAEGFREKTLKNSTIPLEINLVVPQITFLVKTANMLRSSWEKIGFKVNIISQSPDEVANNIIKNRDYEALLFGNILSRSSDLFSFWHSSERFYPGLNLSLYSNKKVDSLIAASRQNLDAEERRKQFDDLQATIANDYPAIFLYSPDYLYLAAKNLNGPEPGLLAEPADRLKNANHWYLKTARVFK